MSNTSSSGRGDELSQLRQGRSAQQAEADGRQQQEALAALRRVGHSGFSNSLEAFYDPANYFDPRDYLCAPAPSFGAVPSTRNDRDEGRNYPVFRTEQELAVVRGAARWLTTSSQIAVGVLNSLTNYVIGTRLSLRRFGAALRPRLAHPNRSCRLPMRCSTSSSTRTIGSAIWIASCFSAAASTASIFSGCGMSAAGMCRRGRSSPTT